jgi:hypothetical protein
MSDYKTMPWSIKGVPESARNVAKEHASAAGMTMGAWLAQLINTAEGVTPTVLPKEATTPHTVEKNEATIPSKPTEDASNTELGQLVLKVAKRLAVLERDTAQFGAAFQDQLSDLRKRVAALENING